MLLVYIEVFNIYRVVYGEEYVIVVVSYNRKGCIYMWFGYYSLVK